MTKLGEAIALAAEVHKTQTDKAGVAYILHPIAVMERATKIWEGSTSPYARLPEHLENVQITAILHDVAEDIEPTNSWDRKQLSAYIYDIFGQDVYNAVCALTKYPRGTETYDQYLDRVAQDWMARIVKIADLSHNLDAFRIPSGKITERDFERWDKYHRALIRLKRED